MNKKISFAIIGLGVLAWVAVLIGATGFPQFNGFHIGDGSGLTNLNTTNFTGFLQVSNMPNFVLTNAHQPHIGIGNSIEVTNFQNGMGKTAIGAGGSFAGYDLNLYGVVNQAFFNSSQFNWFDQNNVQFMLLSRTILRMFAGDISINSPSNYYQGMGSSLTNTWTADYITGRASPVPPLQYNVLNDIGVPGGASTNGVIIGQMAAAFSNGIVNLSTNGMRAAGWRWAILDDGWAQTNRDANNNLQVDANSIPGGSNGLWLLFGFSHTNGFSNILYTSYHDGVGFNTTCSGRAGTPSWLVFNDVDKTLGYGVDGYKVDLCFPGGENRTGYQKEFRDFTSAFQVEFERAVITNAIYFLYSYFQNGIGPGRSFTGSGLDEVYFGNQGECGPVYSQGDITSQLFALKAISAARPFIRPGHYLEVCAISGLGGFSGVAMDTNQLKNAIIVNTIGAAPIVSSSYSNQPALAAICVNTNWISVHQNPAVVPGFPVLSNNLVETWLRPLGGGNLYGAWNVGSSNAVALFNMNVTPQTVNTYWTNLGLPSTANIQVIDDMDSTNVATFPGGFSITVPQTNAMLFTLMPNPTNGIIWVAPGPTNAETGTFSGTGSYQTPFTGDFDLIRSNAPAFTTMMLLPGNYYTDCSQLMKAHQRIVGSGMDITTIIRDPTTKPATNGPSINVLTATTGTDYCEAYDLTLNCNATGTETNAVNGISWLVNGVTIKRAKIINWTGNISTLQEAFALQVGGPNGASGDSYSAQNLVSDVTITNFLGTYGNGILMQSRGLVNNWKVSYAKADNTLTTQHTAGISTANGAANVTFENGLCYGGTQGYYTDTGPQTNIIIRNDQFIGVRRGIEIALSGTNMNGLQILYNNIELPSDTSLADGLGISIWATNGISGPQVIGNSVRMTGDVSFSTNSAGMVGIQVKSNVATNASNVKIALNTLGTNMTIVVAPNAALSLSGVPAAIVQQNTDINGNLLPGNALLNQNQDIKPESYGAVADCIKIYDATITNNTAILGSATANFTPAFVGKSVTLYQNTTNTAWTNMAISSVQGPTAVTLSTVLTPGLTNATARIFTDNTAAFSNALFSAYSTGRGGRVVCATGVYGFSALPTTNLTTTNSLEMSVIHVPNDIGSNNGTSNDTTVEIVGTLRPSGVFVCNQGNPGENGTEFFCSSTVPAGTSTNLICSVFGDNANTVNFGRTTLVLRDLTLRQPMNPALTWIDARHPLGLKLDGVGIDVDFAAGVYANSACSQTCQFIPSGILKSPNTNGFGASRGIITQVTGNSGTTELNDVYVIGYGTAFQFTAEHVKFHNIKPFFCDEGIYLGGFNNITGGITYGEGMHIEGCNTEIVEDGALVNSTSIDWRGIEFETYPYYVRHIYDTNHILAGYLSYHAAAPNWLTNMDVNEPGITTLNLVTGQLWPPPWEATVSMNDAAKFGSLTVGSSPGPQNFYPAVDMPSNGTFSLVINGPPEYGVYSFESTFWVSGGVGVTNGSVGFLVIGQYRVAGTNDAPSANSFTGQGFHITNGLVTKITCTNTFPVRAYNQPKWLQVSIGAVGNINNPTTNEVWLCGWTMRALRERWGTLDFPPF